MVNRQLKIAFGTQVTGKLEPLKVRGPFVLAVVEALRRGITGTEGVNRLSRDLGSGK